MSEPIKDLKKYRSVSILDNLMEQVDKIIKEIYGYATPSAYIHAAIRRKLEFDKAVVSMEKDKEDA